MYCNSCSLTIAKEDIIYCEQCGVPLHKKCANHCLSCGKILCDSCYADNNFRCEDCYKPENMFQVIRRSHIEQYVSCPYSLYLELVLGMAPPMGKHAELGIITHELLDQMQHELITLDDAIRMLDERVEEWNINAENEDYSIISFDLLEVGKNCLRNFELIKDELKCDKFETERNVKFSIDDDLPTISCTLDRISFDGDKVHIHDWKTGKPMSGQKLVTDLQMPLYIYGVFKEFGKMPESFTLHYLNPNKHLTYKRTGDMTYDVKTSRNTYTLDINEALKRTKEVLKNIKNNHFNMPSNATHLWRCDNMCWFHKAGKCDGSQDEQWKKLNEEYSKEDK